MFYKIGYSMVTRFLLLNNNNLVHFYHVILSFNLSEQISRHGLFSENMIQICTKTIYVKIFYSYFYHLIYTNDIVVDFRETKNVVRFNGQTISKDIKKTCQSLPLIRMQIINEESTKSKIRVCKCDGFRPGVPGTF